MLAGTVLPTSTTDTEVEEPREVEVKSKGEKTETEGEMGLTFDGQAICDIKEKSNEGSVPTSPLKVPSPEASSTSNSLNKLSPHICEEVPSDASINNGEAKEAVEEELLVEGEEPEVGVEAEDLFRDIAMRTQALSAPTSFKSSQRQRYYK